MKHIPFQTFYITIEVSYKTMSLMRTGSNVELISYTLLISRDQVRNWFKARPECRSVRPRYKNSCHAANLKPPCRVWHRSSEEPYAAEACPHV